MGKEKKMACKACEAWEAYPANTNQRTAATMDFVLNECIFPSSVNAGEPFVIKVVYKLCTIETRNGDLSHFPGYDGIWWRYIFAQQEIEYWVWKLVEMGLTFMENPPANMNQTKMLTGEIKVDSHGRSGISPGDKFTYTFSGTIEQLLGRQFSTPTTINLAWSLYGLIYGWYEPSDWWPWNWIPSENFLDFSRVCWIKHSIQVDVLPPAPDFPDPTFNVDLCSVSKTTVAPNEQFTIRVTIKNQNETGGSYSIGCYCEGNYLALATGTIGAKESHFVPINVTANQLAQRLITTSKYLAFTIAVSNDQGETDRWTPAAIAVIVSTPPEIANLTGLVTDKQTGAGIAGVSVTILGYSASTDSSGSYTLQGLEPGPYDITFSKFGYWDEIKSKTLASGQNILSITMTPTTEPQPGKTPWGLIAAGAAGIVTIVVVASKMRGAKQK
jgi:hypothetical protein